MTDYLFQEVPVFDRLGVNLMLARGQKIDVLDTVLEVVSPGLKQQGQPVPYVTTDQLGRATFTNTTGFARLRSPKGLERIVYSPQYLDEVHAAPAAAQAAADSAAASAALVGAPAGSAIDAYIGGGSSVAARKADLPLSAKAFGAKGDGTTDDTAALQAWLDAAGTEKVLADGVYRITSGLTISRAKTRLAGAGATILADGDIVALTLTSAASDSRVTVRIDGNLKARGGVAVAAGGCVVESCFIDRVGNPTTSTFNCIGVNVTTHLGVTIRGNVIRNMHGGPGDGTFGNGTGMARAISITSSAKNVPAVQPSMVENNYIDTVEGEEGDAVTILFEPTTLGTTDYFQTGLVTVRNNIIRNPVRRHIKIQATDCVVHQNRLLFDLGSVPANWQGHIQAYRAPRTRITGNETAPVSPSVPHINVSDGVNTPMTGVVVENNIVRFGAGATSDGIYVADLLNSSVKNNVVDGSGITANRVDTSVIQGNTIIGGADAAPAINLIGNNTTIRGNVDQSLTRSVARWAKSGTGNVTDGNGLDVPTLAADYTTRTVSGVTTETTFVQLDNVIQPNRYTVQGRRFKVSVWGQVTGVPTTTTGFRLLLRIGGTLTGEVRIPQTAVVNDCFRADFEVVCTANGNTQRVIGALSGYPNWAGSIATRTLNLVSTPGAVGQSVRISGVPAATTEAVNVFLVEVYG